MMESRLMSFRFKLAEVATKHAALAFVLLAPIFTDSAALAGANDKAPLLVSEAQLAGNTEAGKIIADACTSCHGETGFSEAADIPHLSGQYANYLVTALKAYKSAERDEITMAEVAAKLSDQDIVDVAAYFAGLKPFNKIAAASGKKITVPIEINDSDPFAPAKQAAEDCAGCHGDDGNSDVPGMPGLAGQHLDYLISATKAYRDGGRTEEAMQAFAESLSDGDIRLIATYYAAAEPKRPPAPETGDVMLGRLVAVDCMACHGQDGNVKNPATPRLAGLDAEYLALSIEAYKNGSRNHEAMKEAVAALSPADVENLSAFYAAQKPVVLPVLRPLTTSEWVQKCNRCHGVDGNSTDPRFPILAGQVEGYLIKALDHYHGERRHSTIMQAMSFPLLDADARKLAAYYAGKAAQ